MHNRFYDLPMSRQPDDGKTKRLRRARKALAQSGHTDEIPSSSEQGHARSSWRDMSVSAGQQEPLLTIKGVVEMLSVSRPTVYALMEREGLPYFKIGKSLRFSPLLVRAWLAEHEQIRGE